MTKTFLLSLLLVVMGFQGWACSCIEENLPETHKITKSYQQASLVFTGKVVKAEPLIINDTIHVRSQYSGRDTVLQQHHESIRYTFAVSQLLKGEAAGGTVVVETASQGAACGVNFPVGSEQLVYGITVDKRASFGGTPKKVTPYYATSLCSRHQELRAVKATELRQLRQMARKASGEHRFTWFELGD